MLDILLIIFWGLILPIFGFPATIYLMYKEHEVPVDSWGEAMCEFEVG